ncbi:hypothetical protein, partial [Paenibacillus cymbidii]|uniref:hypothetical protein n=1 Tax=Paenibacillus cymbidii TaxID=1639034 RepID=UPI001A9BD7F6
MWNYGSFILDVWQQPEQVNVVIVTRGRLRVGRLCISSSKNPPNNRAFFPIIIVGIFPPTEPKNQARSAYGKALNC